eukprot:jgi/Ulvmu1/690/UM010_0062.1
MFSMVKRKLPTVGSAGMAQLKSASGVRASTGKVRTGPTKAMARARQNRQIKTHKDLWFAALMLPNELSVRVGTIIQDVSSKFDTGVSTAPPHITLIPPFRMEQANLPALETTLTAFAGGCAPVQIDLRGFGCFEPRVLYIDVVRGEVMGVKERLDAAVQGQCAFVPMERRSFTPHVSIASKRVTPESFEEAWAYLHDQDFEATWLGSEISLLKFNGRTKAWVSHAIFPMQEGRCADLIV